MELTKSYYFKIILISLLSLFFACDAPDTSVYLGNQVPKKYMKEIRDLGLLEENETIKYFYSDALFDIKEGLYFVTNLKLVAYCSEWEEPETIVPFNEITFLNVVYNESFYEDSFIMLETEYGLELEFPVSSEKGRDKDFFNYLLSKSKTK